MVTGTLVLSCLASLLLAASPQPARVPQSIPCAQGTDSIAHDVGATKILEPPPLLPADTMVQPTAEVTNLGTETERYFDVRFRIGSVYDTILTISSIGPGSIVTLYFPVWTAVPGSYTASCSTMLSIDSIPSNDMTSLTFAVLRPLRLYVEQTQSGSIRPDETRDFLYHAELQGDTGAFVSLAKLVVPEGWDAWYFDSTGRHQISDLGRFRPGQRKYFNVRVRGPAGFSVGNSPPEPDTIVVGAFCPDDTTVADNAFLLLSPAPNDFTIHNFPNPLVSRTTFQFNIPFDGKVGLTIYNRAAERVATVPLPPELKAGYHFIAWRAENDYGERLVPGTYEYLLEYTHDGKAARLMKKLVITAE